MKKITRTFEILDLYKTDYIHKEDALCYKQDGEWKKISSKEFCDTTRDLALGLIKLGVKPQDKVAIISGNRPEWTYLDIAISMVGAVSVPIYPTISKEEYSYILHHATVCYVFVSDARLHKKIAPILNAEESIQKIFSFNPIEAENVQYFRDLLVLNSSEREVLSAELEKKMDEVDPDEMVTMIYTSGTTGNPKGVMLSHTNLVSNFTQHCYNHSLDCNSRAISFLPLCHIYERSMLFHFLYKGMSVYFVENLGQIMTAIKEVKPHMFNTVPRLLERIYDGIIAKGHELKGIKKAIFFWAVWLGRRFSYQKRLSPLYHLERKVADILVYSKWRTALGGNVHVIVSGGAALQPRISRVLGAAGINALEGYGLSETSPVISVSNVVTKEILIGTTGPALPRVTIKIADDGEILCKGPNIMLGYYKEPELTKEVIDEEGWFHTGDVGILDQGKYLKITDRKKEIFKLSGGKYIAPQLIENKLKESMFIEQAMIVGEYQKFASALISPNFEFLQSWAEENNISFEDVGDLLKKVEVQKNYRKLIIELNKELGQHEEIKKFRLVKEQWTPNSGELSPTLKLKRKVLKVKYGSLIHDIYQTKQEHEDEKLILPLFSIKRFFNK